MARGGITWITPPSTLARNIEEYGDKTLVAIQAVAEYMSQKIEDYAKVNAPWADRTGNARNLLRGEVDRIAEDMVVIYLIQGVTYGKYLELCHGGKYAIVMKSLEAHYHEAMAMLRRLLA